jgi:succinate dehydrogenase / fumarate reductase flavoprotein subunit
MEDIYGEKGNLMPRDIVSGCMEKTGKDIFLDVTHLGADVIDSRMPEVRDLCLKYGGLDIAKESIPVKPSVHFFMGGLAVNEEHETSIDGLYAVGECASRYHGANRIGGNSLLAAIYSGKTAAGSICGRPDREDGDRSAEEDFFGTYIQTERDRLMSGFASESRFPVMYIRDEAAEIMNSHLGIVRDGESLQKGIDELDYYIEVSSRIRYDSSVLAYFNYSLPAILNLAKATMLSALERRESRGAHIRSDYPDTSDEFAAASVIRYDDGKFTITYDREGRFEH